MVVKFWGVRGGIPTPGADFSSIGGNTTCLEVMLPGGHRVIVDAGSGIRMLGADVMANPQSIAAHHHIFLTHFHWDHIAGLPLFQPLYAPQSTITFYSSKTPQETRDLLAAQMSAPYFPVDFRTMKSRLHFVTTDSPIRFGESEVQAFPVNHPQGAQGYCFRHGGRKIVFATDREHGAPEYDALLLDAARDADALILDAQYTPQEYARHAGWGHSSWQHAAEVAAQVRAKKLMLFHHDPHHNDTDMRQILSEARRHFPQTYLAVEGQELIT